MAMSPVAARPSDHPAGGIRMVVGVLLVVNLLVLAFTVAILRWHLHRAEEDAGRTAQNLTQVLDRQLSGDLQRIDLALFALRGEMTRQMSTGGIRDAELNAYIARLFTQFPELSSIRTANADGRIDHGIGVQPGSAFSVADRAYFAEAQRNPKAGLLISEPVVGRISGQWVLIFARRVERPDGGFAGVAYAATTLDQFTQSMSRMDLGPHGTVTLRGGQLDIYAKYPVNKALGEVVGRRDISPTFQALFQQGRTSAVYKARGGVDGVERTFAFAKIGQHPLYLHVGLGSEDYLTRWRTVSRWSWSLAGLFTLLTSGLAWLLHRAWKRERERAREEVQELRGLLPICASCKKIRDDEGYWNQIESYVQAHSAATFTHGICPDCVTKMYPDLPVRHRPRS
ncbi:MAG: hypothetical protein HXX12_05340 [Geothrix sp.]|uniref:hypothetical protein n=1 Tax=Geothrix sp. TaxID=1962974 RepID=UPI00181793BF|nr:hypothetical protein [Geothrix sp.]NWJ40379.1 hypothetical protein [Geothrix sp.]WIL21616.1 MAG: hypothetical protein QOZ81_000883 [Geothrix sp.]